MVAALAPFKETTERMWVRGLPNGGILDYWMVPWAEAAVVASSLCQGAELGLGSEDPAVGDRSSPGSAAVQQHQGDQSEIPKVRKLRQNLALLATAAVSAVRFFEPKAVAIRPAWTAVAERRTA